MHSSRKVFVLNEDIKCVKTVYESHRGAEAVEFKTFETFEEGDLVVVPTQEAHRHGFTIVKVSEVDVKPDWESDKSIEWIAGKFDPAHFAGVLAQETKILETVSEAERAQRAKEIKEAMFAHVDPKTLQITNNVSVEEGDE